MDLTKEVGTNNQVIRESAYKRKRGRHKQPSNQGKCLQVKNRQALNDKYTCGDVESRK